MPRAVTAVVTAFLLFSAAPTRARTFCDVHYRWQQKIDATHLTMLSWASPPTFAIVYAASGLCA
jgi:hypothetical protein